MAAPRRNSRQAPPRSPSAAPAMAAAGVVLALPVLYFGYPGFVVTWAFIVAAAWMAPPAQFTGKKDGSGFPTAAHAGETKAMQRYRFWADLKYRLIFPPSAILPGWPVYAAWLYGLWAAAAVWCLPYAEVPYVGPLPRFIDAFFVFAIVTQVAAARRRTVTAGDVSPGVRVIGPKKIKAALGKDLPLALGAGVGAALVGAVSASWLLPAPPLPFAANYAWVFLGATGGFGAGVGYWWVTGCLREWRELVEAREEWAPRWQMLKHDPAPRLTKREHVGAAVVDTFTAAGAMGGAMAYWPLAPKVSPTVGAGVRLAILSVPNIDSQGQPQPGTRHPLDFQVVTWPTDALPDVTDPATTEDVASLYIQCAMVWACDASGYARPILDQVTPIALTQALPPEPTDETEPSTKDGPDEAPDGGAPVPAPEPQVSQRQAWGTTWLLPDGPPMSHVRSALAPAMADHLGAQTLTDHRNGFVFVGGLTDGSTIFDPGTGVTDKMFHDLATEDAWNERWADALKQDANPPTIQHDTYAEATLANGRTTVFRQAFTTRKGVDPNDFFGLEPKIKATLDGAPYVAVTGWVSRGRVGERHSQAFTVYWSHDPVPSNPDTLAPPQSASSRGRGARRPRTAPPEAQQWVLAGRMSEAFKVARLAKPEVYEVKCLTTSESRGGHIWRIALRLYGGVTLSEVRGQAEKIRQALGSEWLRVEAAPDGCIIVAGASPSKVDLANPRADEHYIASLNWEQAFLDAKVVGVGGITPNLTAVDRLPNNTQVQVLDFTLPSGLAFVDVKAKSKQMETASKNAFVEVRRHPSGKADEFRMLASEVNPMPERAGFDWDAADTGDHRIPFATNLFGEPTCYDNKADPHLLVSGQSGGGKAQPLHALVPVPVSERFPTGWATIGTLELGDEVYVAEGTTARVNAFSETRGETTYRFHLSDGQVVESGPHHLWKVSTRQSRSMYRGEILARREARHADYTQRAAGIRELAAQAGPQHVTTLIDIARLLGLHETALYQMNLPLNHLGVAAQVPSSKKSRVFDVEAVCDYFDAQIAKRDRTGQKYTFAGHAIDSGHVAGVREAGDKMDGWLTSRAIADALLGKESTRAERDQMKQIVRRQRFANREGLTTFTTRVYPVDEVLNLVADHLDALSGCSDSRRVAMPLLDILSSEEMAAAGIGKGFAICRPEPLRGEAIDAAVDPYVLGAWLGDGRSDGGQFTADPKPSRLDAERRPDADHLRARLAAHYEVRGVPSSEFAMTALGLVTDLRTAGVLATKHIPAAYLRASFDQRLALLQGLMDTDGTVNAAGQCEIDLCDERLARDVQELLRTFGIYTNLRRVPAAIIEADPDNPGAKRQRQTGYRWRQKFVTALPIFNLPRKVARLKATEDLRPTNDWLYIEHIEVTDPQPMRCIGLDHPSHTYLTGGMVPTHNSVVLQNFIYGAIIRGWDLWVVDPSKGAVDFNFAEPYARAIGRTVWEAKGIISAIYDEVMRRKAVNSQYNCGNYRDLPDEVRYNHVLIVLDEFTSMMMPEPVPKAMDDSPETLQAIEAVKALNAARAYIGTYVGKIVREARSTGFTMILATQALKADTIAKIPGANDLKDNMSRMIVGRATFGALMAALKAPTEAPEQPDVLPPGRGLYEGNGRTAEVVQCWFEGSQSVFAEHIGTYAAPIPAERRLDLSGFVEPELDVEGGLLDEGGPIVVPGQVVPTSVVDEPEVKDLGVVELSLDDLELSLDDLEEAAAGDDEAAADSTDSEAPVFDWDAAEAAADELLAKAGVGSDDLPPEWNDALSPAADDEDAVAVEERIVWDEIDPEHWTPETSAYGWAEVDAVLGFLLDFPDVREVVWLDATLDSPAPNGETYRTLVRGLLAERGVALLNSLDEAAALVPEPAPAIAEPVATTTVGGIDSPDFDAEPEATDGTVNWDTVDFSSWAPEESQYGWVAIDALMTFLDRFPDVRAVAWNDPRLDADDEMGVPHRDIVEDLLAERGVTLLAGAPAPAEAPQPVAPAVPAPVAKVAAPKPAPAKVTVDDDDEFGPLPGVPAHLLVDSDEF